MFPAVKVINCKIKVLVTLAAKEYDTDWYTCLLL